MDTLALSSQLNELQQEKKKLHNKLSNLRLRKTDLQSKQEIVMKKNSLLSQKKDSMSRTVDIATMKVEETQAKVDKLQRSNDELQTKVSQLKDKTKQAEEAKENELEQFQEKYDQLADKFRGARNYYVDCVLENEIESWKSTCQSKKSCIESEKQNLHLLSEELNKLKLSKDKVPEEKPPKSYWEIFLEKDKITKSIFEEEHAVLENNLEVKTHSMDELCAKHKSVNEEIAVTKKKLLTYV